ncbi:hypothetical protein SKAU_G00023470 [Synaphobranchus kaupii]|uniref:Transcription initiation factor TFIID subunit 3 n=1 Tax=Synaphobranchus kaupii TaxID=118154 RepID=A0A9Q1JEW4_SYNKA|nr:hypothetical protein SKAU_G00023470 [Synaphobranchus kaupii]
MAGRRVRRVEAQPCLMATLDLWPRVGPCHLLNSKSPPQVELLSPPARVLSAASPAPGPPLPSALPAAGSSKTPVRSVVTETVSTYVIRDEWGNQIWICPGCNKPDDGSPMIGCDDCDDWYHWPCVGLIAAPPEDVQWFCVKCAAHTDAAHTARLRTRRPHVLFQRHHSNGYPSSRSTQPPRARHVATPPCSSLRPHSYISILGAVTFPPGSRHQCGLSGMGHAHRS